MHLGDARQDAAQRQITNAAERVQRAQTAGRSQAAIDAATRALQRTIERNAKYIPAIDPATGLPIPGATLASQSGNLTPLLIGAAALAATFLL